MLTRNLQTAVAIAAAVLVAPAHGADAPPADLDTMMVVDEDAVPEDIIGIISLPQPASETARQRSAKGMNTAGEARDTAGRSVRELRGNAPDGVGDARALGRETAGQARADAARAAAEARDNAADVVESMRDSAAGMRDDVRDGNQPERPEPPGHADRF